MTSMRRPSALVKRRRSTLSAFGLDLASMSVRKDTTDQRGAGRVLHAP